MLSDATRRQLQQLRFLLEEALARTQEQTEIDRHTALVLLDGACEYAMGLALGHVGLRLDENFAKKYSDLRAGLGDWKPDTWKPVRELHEARNLAQHHGTVVDASYLPTWSAQAQRFIDSLVEAAFGVELRSVLVSDAVETEEVRHLLVEAEQALAQEDAAAAFTAAIAGFAVARRAWQGQRTESINQLTLQYTGVLGQLTGGEETDPINRSLLRFEDLLELQPFAPDIAEYHWLVARRGEAEQNIIPSLETARRAFQFVVAWVLRWEAFAVRYEARRYPPPPPPYEPPVTGADHPIVYDADVETLHHIGGWLDDPTLETVRYSVKVTLANVPADDREVWAQQVGDVLNEIIAERGNQTASSGNVDARGVVRVHGVAGTADAQEIREWIDAALVKGDERHRQRLVERRELAARLPALRLRFKQALHAVNTGQFVAGVVSEERDDGSVWIGLQLQIDDAGDPMLQHVLQRAALSTLSGRAGIEYFDTTLWFAIEHDPDDAAAVAATVSDNYRAQAAVRHCGLEEIERRRKALETELRADAARART